MSRLRFINLVHTYFLNQECELINDQYKHVSLQYVLSLKRYCEFYHIDPLMISQSNYQYDDFESLIQVNINSQNYF